MIICLIWIKSDFRRIDVVLAQNIEMFLLEILNI